MDYPNVPAAFINAIAEEGTKDDAVEFLVKQWNETCWLRKRHDALVSALTEAAAALDAAFKELPTATIGSAAEYARAALAAADAAAQTKGSE